MCPVFVLLIVLVSDSKDILFLISNAVFEVVF